MRKPYISCGIRISPIRNKPVQKINNQLIWYILQHKILLLFAIVLYVGKKQSESITIGFNCVSSIIVLSNQVSRKISLYKKAKSFIH